MKTTRKSPAGLSIGLFTALALACLALLAPGASAAGLVAAYSFDEGSGTTAHDLAGIADDGTLEGGASWSPEGKYGGAIDLDGESGRVKIPDADRLDLTGSFTVEAWVRPRSLEPWSPVFNKYDYTTNSGYTLNASNASGLPVGWLADSEALTATSGEQALPTDQWSYLALTYDGEYLRLYLDGKEAAATESPPAAATAKNLVVGKNGLAGTYFDGLIDEVRVYSRALDQDEVETSLEKPIDPSLLSDAARNWRNGSAHNANFDRDGIDDYRVDADIAVLDRGIWEDLLFELDGPPPIDLVKRLDCVNPDPWRESLGEYEPPDLESPLWIPNLWLNQENESNLFGCLEDSGDPTVFDETNGNTHTLGLAEAASGIEGIAVNGLAALGGLAPGARIWSARVLTGNFNFGAYPAAFTYPINYFGDDLGPISSPELPLSCAVSHFEAPNPLSIPARLRAVKRISTTYEDCKTADKVESPVEVRMNTCTYTMHVANTHDPYEGTLDIVCEEAGDEIEIDVFGEGESEAPTCTATIPAQTQLEGIELANNGKEGAERAIEIDAAVGGIAYDLSGDCVESPETRKDGELNADAVLYGANEKEEPVGVFLVGTTSQIRQLKPGIFDETEWLSQIGVGHVIAGLDWAISTREDSDPENDIDVIEMASGCSNAADPTIQEVEMGSRACDPAALDQRIREAADLGIVFVVVAGDGNYDVRMTMPSSSPDALSVTVTLDSDNRPGGKGNCYDDRRWPNGSYGLLADIAAPGCPLSGSSASGEIAGAVAAVSSQCPADDRAGAEYIVDTLMAEGETGEIAEGGWADVRYVDAEGNEIKGENFSEIEELLETGEAFEVPADGFKEPLLDLHDEEVFDPVLIDTETGERNHEPDESADGCPWRSHQAESDVDSDGRADLAGAGGAGDAAQVAEGAYEGPEDQPARAGFEVAEATEAQEGELDPALHDGDGSYAIDTADVDGDRNADLVVAAAEGGVEVYPGEGDGGTDEGDAGFGEAVGSLPGVTLSLNRADGEIEPIAVADIDSDGRADLLAHESATGKLLTYRGLESGKFQAEAVKSAPIVDSALWDNEGAYFIDAIDVTGEELDDPEPEEGEIDYYAKHSYADLVVSDTDGTVYVYPGQGDGGFGAPIEAAEVNPVFDDGAGEEIVGLGDIDRDRRADLLTLAGETLKVRRGQKDGSFEEATEPYEGEVDSSLLDSEGEELVGLLDYSRDGLADLVSVTDEGEVLAYTAQRDRTFADPVAQEGSLTTIRHDAAGYELSAQKPLTRRAGCSASGCHWPFEPNPPRIEADAYPATLTGAGPLAISGLPNPIECEETALEGELEAPAASIELDPVHSQCTTLVGETELPTTAQANGCAYTLAAQNAGPPYEGALGVACEGEEEAIEFKAYSGETLLCTYKLTPQAPAAGLALANAGAGAERSVALSGEAQGIAWERKGLCGKASGEAAGVGIEATLLGADEAEEQIGAYLTGAELHGPYLSGAESEAEAEQPRLEADAYPATLSGTGPLAISGLPNPIECEETALEGELEAPAASIELDPQHDQCTMLSGETELPTTAHANGCTYTLAAQNVGPPYEGALGVVCEGEEEAIEFKAYSGETLLCTYKLTPQAPKAGLALANAG
ncbi:MAG TPA: LamG-like jellyroll fold domain-containing protein, partial [Solirubrobacterales bacterium]|nr:LamG-like jellyroll fold domain-containing protein [Solirubrobacterales bacterium]